jgi:uncharacterized protein
VAATEANPRVAAAFVVPHTRSYSGQRAGPVGISSERMLDALLDLQERDTAADRLRHRLDTLEERAALVAVERRLHDLEDRLADAGTRRDSAAREEQRVDDEASGLEAKAVEVERRMYSGEVASPRELQAMQADVDQLRRHHRSLEDRELALMEHRETLDAEVAELRAAVAAAASERNRLRDALTSAEQAIDTELSIEMSARTELAATVPAELLEDYERCRSRARGVGAARLMGGTCQGCHLSIPATEAERVRRGPPGTVAHCDNCGCILVP